MGSTADAFESYFQARPPNNFIEPPQLPPRPDLFDEIEWGPYVDSKDARLARILWELPNEILRNHLKEIDHPFPRPQTRDEEAIKDTHSLALQVYDHLLLEHMHPLPEADWKTKWDELGMDQETWSFQDIMEAWGGSFQQEGPIVIDNHNVMTASYWTVTKLKQELRRRGLSDAGKKDDLRKRLCDHESVKYTLLPQSDLSHLGIGEEEKYPFKLTANDRVKPLEMYTWAIKVSPYNPTYWVSRAYCHYQQAFYDLAIGDAYRAQLLCEMLVDARYRNRQPGLYSRIWDAISKHILAGISQATETVPPDVEKLRGPNGVNYFIPTLRKALHNIISLCLAAIRAREDYLVMEDYLKQRVIMPARDIRPFDRRLEVLKLSLGQNHFDEAERKRRWLHESRAGSIKGGRLYPYELRDKGRYQVDFVDKLNRKLFEENKDLPWKKCKVGQLPGNQNSLGIFATQSIKKDEIIYAEEPSMRGHLNLKRLPSDKTEDALLVLRCDNCYKEIDRMTRTNYRSRAAEIKNGRDDAACECCLVDTDDRLCYCPADEAHPENKTCSRIARKLYHFKACGKDWTWLHDAMRPCIMKWRAWQDWYTHTNEKHGTVLSLLLREAFDVTLKRRVENNNPSLMAHEIDELIMLEDPKDWQDPQAPFPFTFAANIQVPFDILMQLGVDIFRDLTFDTWVIQTVLRKLLVNAVPWAKPSGEEMGEKEHNKIIHEKVFRSPRTQARRVRDFKSFKKYDPSFQALYLFPGFSLFNHACPKSHNAEWGFDDTIPNRVLVWATKDIAKDEEICIPYTRKRFLSTKRMRRELGRTCTCPECTDMAADATSDDDSDYKKDDRDDDSVSVVTVDSDNQDNQDNQGNQGNQGNQDNGDGESNDDDLDRGGQGQQMATKTGQHPQLGGKGPIVYPLPPTASVDSQSQGDTEEASPDYGPPADQSQVSWLNQQFPHGLPRFRSTLTEGSEADRKRSADRAFQRLLCLARDPKRPRPPENSSSGEC